MTAALRKLKQEREEAREEGAILENLKAIQKKLQKGKDMQQLSMKWKSKMSIILKNFGN